MAQNKTGLSYLAAAQAAYKDHLTRIEVPEFGEGAVVYGKAPTVEDRAYIIRKADGDSLEAAIWTVIRLAMDEHGKPLFTLEEKMALKASVSADVIEALAYRLNASISYAEARKK